MTGRRKPEMLDGVAMAGELIDLVRGDITEQAADALVNAANSSLVGGGGVDGAIHSRGGPAILEECRRLRAEHFPKGLPAGQAVATTAGRLQARWVIHAVGPVYSTRQDRTALLISAYENSLVVAGELGARSVVFPALSAGAYGWPVADAARVAIATVSESAAQHGVDVVRFVLFTPAVLQAFEAALWEASN